MLEQNQLGCFLKMNNKLVKLVLALSVPVLLTSCMTASSQQYVEPVQQVDRFNFDYDYR